MKKTVEQKKRERQVEKDRDRERQREKERDRERQREILTKRVGGEREGEREK